MVLNLVIILFIALCAFLGYKKGLIKVAISLVSFIIAMIVTLVMYKAVANLVIEKTQIDDNIQNSITTRILPKGISENDKVQVDTNIPSIVLSGTENTVKEISSTLTIKIIELGSLLIVFVVTKIALKFITAIANLIAKIPILKEFNEIGGLIYGILQALVWIFVIFAIISLAAPIISPEYIEEINKSFLASIIYNNNILLNIIM